MARQDGFWLAENESGSLHRGYLVHSFAEGVHECAEHPQRQDDVVRDIHMTFVISAFGMGILDKFAKVESPAKLDKL